MNESLAFVAGATTVFLTGLAILPRRSMLLTVAWFVTSVVGLTFLAPAHAVPVDPCVPAVVQPKTSSPVATKPSPIIQWVTVRSGSSKVPGLRCTDPVFTFPEPELIGFDIEVPFPELFLDEHPVIWPQPEFKRDWLADHVVHASAKKKRRPWSNRPPMSVPEPSPLWLFGAGLAFLGWIGWERAQRRMYLDAERRRKRDLWHPDTH